MTSVAQMALRRIMEKYTANTRFCIIANYTHKLSPALLSRCTRFRFSPLKERDIRQLVDIVIEKEDVKIQPEAVDSLVRLSKGDMRRALNVLQACHASSMFPFQSFELLMQGFHISAEITHTISRHSITHQRPTATQKSQTRNHNQQHHLRLHCRSSPLRHPAHP